MRKEVFLRHRDDFYFGSLPHTLVYFLMRLPFALVETALWCGISYFMVRQQQCQLRGE